MAAQLTPSKRQNDQSLPEITGRKKWQKTSILGSDGSPSRKSAAKYIMRLLCPASKIDVVIGKDGIFLDQICRETGTEGRVEESVIGCDERVIVVEGPRTDIEVEIEQVTTDDKYTETLEAGDVPVENVDTNKSNQSVPVDGPQSVKEKGSSSVQKAVLILFDKISDVFSLENEGDEKGNQSSSLVFRLLVFSSQVGRLLGKAGSVIKEISAESGTQIRILPKDKRPSCASFSDELVQITGGVESVRKALQSVTEQLFENCRETGFVSSHGPSETSSHSHGPPRHDKFSSSDRQFRHHGAPYTSGFHNEEANIPGRLNFHPDVLTFRLLCNAEKVGCVIGKGGAVIKALQHETGCEIKVLDDGVDSADSEDRIIVISGPAHPDDGISAPQDALLRVQTTIFRAPLESKEKTLTAKLLVFSNQIGCLLGKGGSIIAEMRKSTGAYIRILGKDQTPKCASENEEVVQVNGEYDVVQEALLQISTKLRNLFFRDAFPPLGLPPHPGFMDQMPPFPSYMGRREFSPPGAFPRGPPFHQFDGPGALPPEGGFHPHDDHPPFAHEFFRPGMRPHMSERMPPAAPWGPQGPREGMGPLGFPDYPGPPQRRISGFAGGNQLGIITSTTMEVVVPSFVIPAIYGEDGGCLRQIHEISEAKITITDSKPGAKETAIIIDGTPEQTNAAQSLIQAFVISETEAH